MPARVHPRCRQISLRVLASIDPYHSIADWAVVYYAGHGIEAAGVNYLIPIDAKIASDRDIGLEAVPIDQILNAVERARALRLVILDARRDNPFANQMKRTQTIASRSVGHGLARIEPNPGTLVVFAAKHGETDGDGEHSPLTSAFVKDIRVPGVEVCGCLTTCATTSWT
jgi:uncharacterized caspase-like protein